MVQKLVVFGHSYITGAFGFVPLLIEIARLVGFVHIPLASRSNIRISILNPQDKRATLAPVSVLQYFPFIILIPYPTLNPHMTGAGILGALCGSWCNSI